MVAVFIGTSLYLGLHFYDVIMQRRIEAQIGDLFEKAKNEHGDIIIPPIDPEDLTSVRRGESDWARERRMLLEAEERGKEIYAEILALNPDFRGMIEVPGLVESQPYVHSKESGDYLNTDFFGNRNRHGTVYLSSLNSRLLMDNNSVFYGHHLQTSGMFAQLMKYKYAETFKKSPIVILDGLIGKNIYIVFSAHVSEPEHWYTSPVIGKEAYADYLDELQARSLYITNVDVTTDDRIITLSVCDYTFEDMRFLVHARKLRPGEEIPTEVIAEPNLNRKDYEVSNLNPIREISLRNTAVAQNPRNGRMFYYQMQNGFINRYSGSTVEAQGPFRAYSGPGIVTSSFATAFMRNVNEEDELTRALYIAIQATGSNKGINLYTAGMLQGIIRHEGLVTPAGVDARFPAFQGTSGSGVWLFYNVPSETDSRLYRVLIQNEAVASEPEYLFTVYGVTDARPLGYFIVDGEPLVVWHESANGFIRAGRPGGTAIYSINDGIVPGARVMTYADMSGHGIRLAVERYGRISFAHMDVSALHYVHDALPPEDEDYTDPDDPDGDDNPDGDDGDETFDDDPDGNEPPPDSAPPDPPAGDGDE